MRFFVAATVVLVGVLASGCASRARKPVNPPTTSIENQIVSGKLSALCDDPDSCRIFELTLKNKTEKTLEIDWNRSYYINNGKADGGLYFDGIVIAQRNNQRPPEIILPNSSLEKNLIPNNNFEFKIFPLAHWDFKYLQGYSHGVYLTLKSDGKEEVVNVSLDLRGKSSQ